LINENRRNGLDVSAETCIPDWRGEKMDGEMLVGTLMALDN